MFGLDADRKGVDAHLAVADREGEVPAVQPALAREVAGKVECVVAGLESHEVVFGKRGHQPLMAGQRGQHFGRRTGNMQEIADAVPVSPRA